LGGKDWAATAPSSALNCVTAAGKSGHTETLVSIKRSLKSSMLRQASPDIRLASGPTMLRVLLFLRPY
jgi:hypothetical protein